jgi:hypothetical protein
VRRVDDRLLSMLPSKQREQFIADLLTIVQMLSSPPVPDRRRR